MYVRVGIVKDYMEKGLCCREIAKIHGCSPSTVSRVISSYRLNGKVLEEKRRGGIVSTHYTQDDEYRRFVRQRMHLRLVDLREEIRERFNKTLSLSTISRFRRNLIKSDSLTEYQNSEESTIDAPVLISSSFLFPSDFGHWNGHPPAVVNVHFSDSDCFS